MNKETKTRKAIALLSGGLDSALAAKIVKAQGIEVTGLHLLSPFGCKEDVAKVADSIGIPLLVKEKGPAYLDLVQNPRYGYGSAMNPCIDCRIFMFQLADVVRQDERADFIVTGEVVGQRPMSQTRHALDLIDHKSPLEGLVLRPLSAQNLAPTIPEMEGWVNREELFQIAGRSRKEQNILAEQFNVTTYSQPGGGCLLTESSFSPKLKDFFKYPTYESDEERLAQSELLRYGRHFRLSEKTKVVVGRNEADNHALERLWPRTKGILFSPKGFIGPTALALGEMGPSEKQAVAEMIVRYGKTDLQDEKAVEFSPAKESNTLFVRNPISEDRLKAWRL